jgi:hypothetical protein
VDVFFPEGEEDLDSIQTIVQPDILVVCDPAKLIEEGVRGAPDFIVEILSPATALKDQSEKKELYEKKGVREYWIVNPNTLETFVYLLRDGSYGLPLAHSLRESVDVTIFPPCIESPGRRALKQSSGNMLIYRLFNASKPTILRRYSSQKRSFRDCKLARRVRGFTCRNSAILS